MMKVKLSTTLYFTCDYQQDLAMKTCLVHAFKTAKANISVKADALSFMPLKNQRNQRSR